MFVDKTATEFYQLFSGICDKKLFLQIGTREGELKYSFESPELDMTDTRTICIGMMDAWYDFFDPAHFVFDESFVLGEFPLTIKREGQKVVFEKQEVIKCQTFQELSIPDQYSWIFLATFLPFEKPLELHKERVINYPGSDLFGPMIIGPGDMYE